MTLLTNLLTLLKLLLHIRFVVLCDGLMHFKATAQTQVLMPSNS